MKQFFTTILVILLANFAMGQSITTNSPSVPTQTTVTLYGYANVGGGSFFGVEFEYDTNSSFSSSTSVVPSEGTNLSSNTSLSYSLTGLTPNTTYFYRAKVGYSTVAGTGLTGSPKSFTTAAATVPTVVIGTDFSSITNSSASNTGNNVTDNGGNTVTDKGLVISTSMNPTTADTKISIATGLGSYNGNITGCSQLTKYYVRAYAINSNGTGYSSVTKTFNTKATTNASITSMVSNASGELTINYDAGTGSNCIIYVRANNQILDEPANGSSYSGNTAFGSGDDLGNTTYVVYSGAAAKGAVTVTNLNASNDYYFKIASYSGSGTSTIYDLSNGQTNSADNSNLPVSFIDVYGKSFDFGQEIHWTTATEVNNNYFVVERSDDAKVFEEVGRVKGAGNSNQLLQYSLLDPNKVKLAYYRIKQVDFDGKYTYSPTIMVQSNLDQEVLNYMSAQNGVLNLSIQPQAYQTNIELWNTNGSMVKSIEIKGTNMENISIPLQHLASGLYILRIRSGAKMISKKFLL